MEIKVVQGDDLTYTLTVNDADGNAVDLTGASAAVFTVKKNYSDDTAVIEKTLGAGVVITTPASGVVTVTLSDSDTDIEDGTYMFELQVTDSSGNISTVRKSDNTPGTFTVLKQLST